MIGWQRQTHWVSYGVQIERNVLTVLLNYVSAAIVVAQEDKFTSPQGTPSYLQGPIKQTYLYKTIGFGVVRC